jgi:hypothetical protein
LGAWRQETVNKNSAKKRVSIPSSVRDSVLREFHHRCAICGADRPHIHHIDENPGNNDLSNLLPICPNCHLTDQHNPTVPTDPEKLALFRRYKDPAILAPQFEPLFARMRFLARITDSDSTEELEKKARELEDFVTYLEMGGFYSKAILELLEAPSRARVRVLGAPPDPREEQEDRKYEASYRQQLRLAQPEVFRLVIELLRYQKWTGNQTPSLAADGWHRR